MSGSDPHFIRPESVPPEEIKRRIRTISRPHLISRGHSGSPKGLMALRSTIAAVMDLHQEGEKILYFASTIKGLVGYKAILPKPLCNFEFLPALENT